MAYIFEGGMLTFTGASEAHIHQSIHTYILTDRQTDRQKALKHLDHLIVIRRAENV
jgi:hypothetical protein